MTFPLSRFAGIETPFYYYDLKLLTDTLNAINGAAKEHPNFHVHYAVKANANPRILQVIAQSGLGADCVSGGEVEAARASGFQATDIVFAGVGKSDKEIQTALNEEIFCFNVESIPELEVINSLAAETGKTARIAFRVNPNVDAHTHKKITTRNAKCTTLLACRMPPKSTILKNHTSAPLSSHAPITSETS